MSMDLDPPSRQSIGAAWSPARRGFFPMRRGSRFLSRPPENWEGQPPSQPASPRGSPIPIHSPVAEISACKRKTAVANRPRLARLCLWQRQNGCALRPESETTAPQDNRDFLSSPLLPLRREAIRELRRYPVFPVSRS